jgi:integrase
MRPTTQATYRSALKHLDEYFGRARLSDITPGDVAAFVAAQQRAGYKGWSIKGHLATLSGIFKYAGRHLGFSGTNPVSLLDKVERPSLDDERPKRTLSADELRRLIAAVDEPYRLVFEFAAETGARLGEALGLVWGDVDLGAQTVCFKHQLAKRGERVALKTKRSRRCVEITPGLVEKLRAARIAARASGEHDFVFLSRAGTPHDHRNIGGRVLARAIKRAGLEAIERDGQVVKHAPTFHNLRHSHGSALIAAGWDIEEVSARLGHANVATTMRAYIHEYEAARRSDDRRNRLATIYGSDDATPGAVVASLPVKSRK